MVFYRKYRPQTIADLDSSAVREKLFSVLAKDTHHAFLFTGPKGLGKTSTARIIAKVVNCESKETIEPCNVCEQCVSITNGTNMDVLEIDAASNRGIDEIRELKEKIRLAPLAAKKKVYIIDEVHMLTTEAFNALLKTLEEPPSHAMFILCTTEPHKIPATILSRCLHINFNLATDDEIVRSLKRVAAGEKITIDDDALYAIARMADGGFRDGVKILEEVSLGANKGTITKESFENSYKTANILLHVVNLFVALKEQNIKKGLEIVKELVGQGVDIKFFIYQVLVNLHKKLLEKLEVEEATSPDNVSFTVDEIKVLVELFSGAYQDMKYAVLPQLPLELAIIEWCQQEKGTEEAKETNAPKGPTDSGVTVSSLRKQVGTIKKIQALYGEKPAVKEEKKHIETTTVELMHASPNGEITKEWLDVLWKSIIAEMKKHNHTIAGVLRGCALKSYDNKVLTIQTNYKFHQERLDDMKTRDALMNVCKLLTGKDVSVEVELKK